ncbi:hypothetical protein HYU23_00395 [Candidatus Woesearchaeota archaeon]|nr:hypothetical protein [Candidatus Woesearchaeota archaeon]
MTVETKLVRKFGAKVLLVGSRTPVPILEKALEVLPDSLLEIAIAKDQPDDLGFYGDNSLGLVLMPRDTKNILRVDPPEYLNASYFISPEGRYLGFCYQGHTYAIKVEDPK